MKHTRIIRQENYDKASRLLGELFDVSSYISEQINSCIKNNGITDFFENLEDYDFPEEILEKLKAVKTVLFGLSEEAIVPEGGEVFDERTE